MWDKKVVEMLKSEIGRIFGLVDIDFLCGLWCSAQYFEAIFLGGADDVVI